MARHHIGRQALKLAMLSLAALSGVVECAALLRARLAGQQQIARQN